MPQTLADFLEDLERWLDESKGTSGVNGAVGQLPPPNVIYVGLRLNNVEVKLADLRDPQTQPNLDPPDIGDVITSYNPVRTCDFADICYQLAHQALASAQSGSPDDEYIGDRMATIENLLPGYKHIAGI